MKLVFATHNSNKFKEVNALMPSYIELVSLTDIGCHEDIAETATTIEGNAQIKADYVTNKYQLPCFADDTGLLVDALDGAPGVYSARFAGEEKSAEDNMNKLIALLKEQATRTAHFKTVIAYNTQKETLLFEGLAIGHILQEKRGTNGFGYDPIFQPEGYQETFAELSLDIKNKISHRAKAIEKFVSFLKTTS